MSIFFRRELKEKVLQDKFGDRLSEVERQLRMIQLEWQDTLDRLKTMMHRVIKERQRADALKEETPDDTPPPEAPQLDPVSARILARRHRISGGTQ